MQFELEERNSTSSRKPSKGPKPHLARRGTKAILPSERHILMEQLQEDEKEERKKEKRKRKSKMRKKKKNKNKIHTRKAKKHLQQYKAVVKWWQKPSIQYAMGMVRETLEKLMGSNLVSVMDRNYMEKLKVRLLEDFSEMMDKRIKEREAREYQRVKHLVLTGKIPFEQAPEEMAEHIVIVLENYCNELIEKRRAGYKIPKPKIPTYLYWDDTPDPPSRLTIERGHKYRRSDDPLCKPIEYFLKTDEEEDINSGYMFEPMEYRRLKYVDLMVRQLFKQFMVVTIYDLADEIMNKGVPEVIDENLEEQEEEETTDDENNEPLE